jgi:hypothetical protein
MAALPEVMMFILLLAAQGIVGLYVAAYAGHCLLVVVQQTAAGNDEVVWPEEPFLDWVGEIFYLTWLLAVWLVPAWFVLRLVDLPVFAASPTVSLGVLAVGLLWLIFPISLLSSLSANSRYVLFRLTILKQLAKRLPAVAGFYVASAALLLSCSALVYLSAARAVWLLLPVAALAVASAVLIYARLLGRIAWLISYQAPGKRRKSGPGAKRPATAAESADERASPAEGPQDQPGAGFEDAAATDHSPLDRDWPATDEASPRPRPPARKERRPENKHPVKPKSRAADPWAPPVAAPAPGKVEPVPTPDNPTGEGYAILDEAPAPGSAPVPLDGYEPIGLEPLPAGDPAGEAGTGSKTAQAKPLPPVSRFEERLAQRPAERPPPVRPLLSGVYNFPWYPQCLGPWLWLCFGTLVWGALFQLWVLFWPRG